MSVAVITGSGGLIGSEAVAQFASLGFDVVGIDNDMRAVFFGPDASTRTNVRRLETEFGRQYRQQGLDVRDRAGVLDIFQTYGRAIELVIHAAAQPSHDWAARDPFVDFDINAVGTLNLLEATRRWSPDATFIFMSTNKVYGDRANDLPMEELETRFEILPDHVYAPGIAEDMPLDRCLHSLFGASKVAADVLVQEYGRYFGMRTACFRAGTLTGPLHAPAELHGFLAYLVRCVETGTPYTVFGYKGKQVRDALHSSDLVAGCYEFFKSPRIAEVYNMGGGRMSNCSVLEAIEMCQEVAGRPLNWSYDDTHRTGDHIWWISDYSMFQSHYPAWTPHYTIPRMLDEMHLAYSEK
jgi:CDP-paratose 2-epimerase